MRENAITYFIKYVKSRFITYVIAYVIIYVNKSVIACFIKHVIKYGIAYVIAHITAFDITHKHRCTELNPHRTRMAQGAASANRDSADL